MGSYVPYHEEMARLPDTPKTEIFASAGHDVSAAFGEFILRGGALWGIFSKISHNGPSNFDENFEKIMKRLQLIIFDSEQLVIRKLQRSPSPTTRGSCGHRSLP